MAMTLSTRIGDFARFVEEKLAFVVIFPDVIRHF